MDKIVYVGYKVDDENIVKKMEPIVGDYIIQFRPEIYTVRQYYRDTDQGSMRAWYNKNTNDKLIGYLRRIYIKEYRNRNTVTIVGEINVESGIYYITFVNGTNVPLQQVKLFVNRGDFGPAIELSEKLPIEMKKCIFGH